MIAKVNYSLKILFVDDDDDERELFESAIRSVNDFAIVKSLNSGEKLIDHLIKEQSEVPDIIFLDINMPRKDGIECLKELRKEKSLEDVPIVMYSNSPRTDDITECYNSGANIFITKPFSYKDEVHLMKSIISFYCKTVFLATA